MLPEVVVPSVVKVVRPRLAPRVLGGDKFVTVVDKIGDRTRKLGVVATAVAALPQSGDVILPDNADGVIGLFLGGKLTKRKGHEATKGHFEIWRTFHATSLGESNDYWLKRCENDSVRAKVWALFMKSLYDVGLKERQVGKIMSGVKHHFDINTKSTSFLAETVVTSMKKAIKPTTSEIRAQAIESAENVKLPLSDAGIDLMHARDWVGVKDPKAMTFTSSS